MKLFYLIIWTSFFLYTKQDVLWQNENFKEQKIKRSSKRTTMGMVKEIAGEVLGFDFDKFPLFQEKEKKKKEGKKVKPKTKTDITKAVKKAKQMDPDIVDYMTMESNKFESDMREKSREQKPLELGVFVRPGMKKAFIMREKLKAYYYCLNKRMEALSILHRVTARAKTVYVGETRVKLYAYAFCRHPIYYNEVHWQHKHSQRPLKVIYPDYSSKILTPDGSLEINGIRYEDEGDYFCISDSVTVAIWRLEVEYPKYIQRVSEYVEPFPKLINFLDKYKLKIITLWKEWTPCSRCMEMGTRTRFGGCHIQTTWIPPSARLLVDHENQSNLDEAYEGGWLSVLSTYFETGIPCRSPLVPKKLSTMKIIQERKSELETGYCRVRCERPILYEKLPSGIFIPATIEKLEDFGWEGISNISSDILETTVLEETGRRIQLKCIGASTKYEVTWTKNSKLLLNRNLRKENKGRILKMKNGILQIRKLKEDDQGVYSCWQSGRVVATVKLLVEEEEINQFNNRIKLYIICGFIIILAIGFVFTFF